jgi:hypothetical protein
MIWFVLVGIGCLALGYYVGWSEAKYDSRIHDDDCEKEEWVKTDFKIKY